MKYVTVDIGGSNVKAAVMDSGGVILKSVIPSGNGDELVDAVINQIEQLMMHHKISAVAAGAPGLTADGTVKFAPNLGWNNLPLQSILQDRLGLPARVINDATAAALGEKHFGAGVNYADMLMLTLGTGVGGAYIQSKQCDMPHNGENVIQTKKDYMLKETGGEIGHIIVNEGGEQCGCGLRGCLEAYASASALVRETKRAVESGVPTIMRDMPLSGTTPFRAEARGDSEGSRIVSEYVRHLATGILSLNNIFRPQIFVLGGGVAGEGENLTKRLDAYLSGLEYGFKNTVPPKITTAALGNDAALFGLYSLLI